MKWVSCRQPLNLTHPPLPHPGKPQLYWQDWIQLAFITVPPILYPPVTKKMQPSAKKIDTLPPSATGSTGSPRKQSYRDERMKIKSLVASATAAKWQQKRQ